MTESSLAIPYPFPLTNVSLKIPFLATRHFNMGLVRYLVEKCWINRVQFENFQRMKETWISGSCR